MNIFRFILPLFTKKTNSFIRQVRNRISYMLMSFSYKGHRRNIVLPDNFDLEEHLREYPPENYGLTSMNLKFSKDKIYYFLSLLSTIPARNKDLINEEGWVPINMKKVRNSIKDIKAYKDYLIRTQVIECDNIAIINEKSFYYRWTRQYRDSSFSCQNVTCAHEEDAYFLAEENNTELSNKDYLSYWYNTQKLEINETITSYAKAVLGYKLRNTNQRDLNPNTNQLKDPLLQYSAALINIDKLKRHQYEVHIDTTVHRLHSVITNLQKDYRNFITYDGQNLVCIDLKNCQPYLACLLLKTVFWQINTTLPLNLYRLPLNIQQKFTTTNITTKVINFLQQQNDEDFSEYIESAGNGKIYEIIQEKCQAKLHQSIDRKTAKTLMFYLLFSSNQGQHDDNRINQMRRIFNEELFPPVARLFRIIKHRFNDSEEEKQHNRLSCLLQSIESEIILNQCCKRIWEEGNHEVPVFTIHDSISTTIDHQNFVKKIMLEELTQTIGISPTLSEEYWNIGQIEHPELLTSSTQ